MRSKQLRNYIRSELDKVQVIDSHEHTEFVELTRSSSNPLFQLLARSFIKNDLANMGVIEPRWKAAIGKDVDGWANLKLYIDLCRNTGYFRCFLIAAKDLLQLPIRELSDSNWGEVSQALVQANRRPDWYEYVLKTRGNVDVVLWDQMYGEPRWPTMDHPLFIPVERFDRFGDIAAVDYRKRCVQDFGIEPATIADVLDIIDSVFERDMEAGIAGVKIAAAYFRAIRFQKGSRTEASRIFSMLPKDISYPQLLAYQDFIYSHVIQRCVSYDLPIQIHTGMQSAPGYLHNGYPPLLEETIARYPDAKFVLLHGGYPFTAQAADLAARHTHVYVDGSWLTILSPSAYRKALSEWLDVLPVERILAWGGDAMRVEMTYGSLVMAKDIVADVLAEKVQRGCFDLSMALHIAHRIFRENLRELFKTDEVREKRQRRNGRHAQRTVA